MMRKLLLLIFVVFLCVPAVYGQDMIITKQADTIRCEVHFPPPPGGKIFYYIEEEGERVSHFVQTSKVRYIIDGTTDRSYIVNSYGQMVELLDKIIRLNPSYRHRIGVGGGINIYSPTHNIPTVYLDYTYFFKGKDFGVGLMVDYLEISCMKRRTVKHLDHVYEYYNAKVGCMFLGAKISQRFYIPNSNSYFYTDLAFGYCSISRNMMHLYEPEPTYGFNVRVGWELLFTQRHYSAFDIGFYMSGNTVGVTLGLKVGA